MHIHIQNLGKKFQYEWIFKNLNLELEFAKTYTFIGANGSGKSTLLQIIAGILSPNLGTITYQLDNQIISPENYFRYLSLAAPYLELIEEFTLSELVKFHLNFKSFKNQLSAKDFIQILGLEKAKNKPLKYYSSGMKQRVKLGLAFYSDTPILLLDEPTSNLDKQGIAWYQKEIGQNLTNRLIILCSNQAYEYEFCENVIDISKYK